MSRLSDLSRLIASSRRAGMDARPTLLRIIVDLFVDTPVRSAAESERFRELVLRLFDVADLPTRIAVAERLAPCAHLPRPVMVRLALDDFAVAGPVIRSSPLIDEPTMQMLEGVAGPKHRLAIAARRALDQIDRGETAARMPAPKPETTAEAAPAVSPAETSAGPAEASFADIAFEVRAMPAAPRFELPKLHLPTFEPPKPAAPEPDLPVLALPPMPVTLAPPARTAAAASPPPEPAVQDEAVAPAPAPVAPATLAELLAQDTPPLAALARAFLDAPADVRLAALTRLAARGYPAAPPPAPQPGVDLGHVLEQAALHRRADAFGDLIARGLDLPQDIAAAITRDASGEALVVALKALDIASQTVLRILLFLNPEIGVSVTRVFALSTMFDEMDRHVALQLLAGWRAGGAPAATPAAHVPVTLDDQAARAPRTSRIAPAPRIVVTPVRRGAGDTR